MKTLIVYYSYTHNNEKLANLLRQKLHCDILKIEELKKRTGFTILLDLLFGRHPAIKTDPCSLRDYDHIIFVAPIWAGQIGSPLKTFLAGENKNIKSYSFITACGGDGQKEKFEKQLFLTTNKEPLAIGELPIHELLLASNKKINTTQYRITEKDWAFFELQLEDFLSTKGMPLASGWKVETD